MDLAELASDTDLCVKCGLCLPYCPTYAQTLDENESPRGRIALIQGWANGQLDASPELVRHVDNCLLCRACEAACPAYVPYGRIVDRFRAEAAGKGKRIPARAKALLLRMALTGRRMPRFLAGLLASRYGREVMGLGKYLGFGSMIAGLPEPMSEASGLSAPRPDPPLVAAHATVQLFTGCTGSILDGETLASARKVLHRLGVAVAIPEDQTCCGALHWHAGETAGALALMARNLSAFDQGQDLPIVNVASGCGAMLKEYRDTVASPEAERFSARIRDIGQFLEQVPWPENLRLRPLPAKVCLHSPCSLRNVLRAERQAAALLKRIPELNLIAVPAQIRCCGAAGSYALEQPVMAENIREASLDWILAQQPDYLATSNPGCAVHLRAGLAKRGYRNIQVLHPVTLIARQLDA